MNNDLYSTIGDLILEIMGADEMTATVIDVELEQEYPQAYHFFVNQYVAAYKLHGCGRYYGHINAVADALGDLESRGLVEKLYREGGEICWRAVGQSRRQEP